MKKIKYKYFARKFKFSSFAEYSTFGALSPESLRFLLEHGEILKLSTGEKLFEAGERSDSFYIILEGSVGFFYHVGTNTETFQGGLKRGMEVGVTSMMALQPRWGSARMEAPGVVLKVPTNLFHDFQLKYSEDFNILMINLMREVCRRFIRMSTLLGDVALENKEIEILSEADRML